MTRRYETREWTETKTQRHTDDVEIVECDDCGAKAQMVQGFSVQLDRPALVPNLEGWFTWGENGPPGSVMLAEKVRHYCSECVYRPGFSP